MKRFHYFLLLAVICLSGCTKTANIVPADLAFDPQEGQLAPVQLFVNRNVFINDFMGPRVASFERALKESGAFVDISSNVESPYILDTLVTIESNSGVMHTAGTMVSAASLFLIPTKVTRVCHITATLYGYGQRIAEYELKQEYSDSIGFHNKAGWTGRTNEFYMIINLAHQLINAIEADNALPKILIEERAKSIDKKAEAISL